MDLFSRGMFIAGWSRYAFETAVCYTREFKNPASDTKKAIIAAGLFCVILYSLVAAAFQGHLGLEGSPAPGLSTERASQPRWATWSAATTIVDHLLEMMMIPRVDPRDQMAMAGSSRTLYQGGVDGWLPKYLGHVNEHGAPTRAMWTDLIFNLGLLTFAASDATAYYLILSISNVGYMIFIFLNLQATWIPPHRQPAHSPPIPGAELAYRRQRGFLGFFNLFLMGVGAKVWVTQTPFGMV